MSDIVISDITKIAIPVIAFFAIHAMKDVALRWLDNEREAFANLHRAHCNCNDRFVGRVQSSVVDASSPLPCPAPSLTKTDILTDKISLQELRPCPDQRENMLHKQDDTLSQKVPRTLIIDNYNQKTK